MRIISGIAIAAILASVIGDEPASGTAAYPDLTVTVADPGIQSYAASGLDNNPAKPVETFSGRSSVNFTSDTVGVFSGSGGISNADQWGGAGGTGQYMTASNVLLTLPSNSDYKYVGFWWSAGNHPNNVELLNASGGVLARFEVDENQDSDPDGEDLLGVTSSNSGYTHNPNTAVANRLTGEKYAFVHLRYPPGFRKVRFQGTGFEFDNVTISLTVPDVASTEVTTETFNPYTLSTPSVLIADPRTGNVSFPGVTLGAGSGETNAMLCFAEVESNGTAISSTTVQATGSGTGITNTSGTNLRTFAGTRTAVTSFSPNIDFTSSSGASQFAIVGSRYLRVTATPQTSLGSAGCTGNAVVSTIVEVRFLRPYKSNSINIPID